MRIGLATAAAAFSFPSLTVPAFAQSANSAAVVAVRVPPTTRGQAQRLRADGEAAIALRAIEQGARTLRAPHENDAVYLELTRRLLQVDAAETPQAAASSSGSLILP